MTTTCEPSHHLSFKNLEIPPRKLHCSHDHTAMNLHKYLPSNKNTLQDDDDNDTDPYGTDHFRMYEFKVRKCTRSRSHDWTDCPFAHPGEKARRRDPNRYRYSSTICSDFRRGGSCPRGDDCDFAHGVFECWLHPTRYRTEACKDGKNCKRKVCFFAHSPRELRLLPEPSPKYKNSDRNNSNHCCLFCHSVTSSPTSTLLGLSHFSRSPSSSPPLSPLKHTTSGFSPVRRSKFGTEMTAMTNYDDVLLNELMCSLENMNFHEVSSPMAATTATANYANAIPKINPWVDVSFNGGDMQQQQNGVGYDHDPDLGWVNELLM